MFITFGAENQEEKQFDMESNMRSMLSCDSFLFVKTSEIEQTRCLVETTADCEMLENHHVMHF
jgi:hypothetical protein